jgi:hypothetical protein
MAEEGYQYWKVYTCRLDIVGERGEFSGQGLI